jgi:diacylglycerol kinase family enzyme
MLRRQRPGIDLRATTAPGQGAELARLAVLAGHTNIVAAGGDGTVHEVANGLLDANVPDTVFGVWPIGSANDYAFALGISGDWPLESGRELPVRSVDVGRVSSGGKSRFFVNGLGLGFNSAVTLEAESIPYLRGMALYGLAFIRAVWRHYCFPRLRIDFDETTIDQPTLALTVNLGQREGGFRVTPQADLSDGWFDVVRAGALSRFQALKLLLRLASGTLPTNHPLIQQCRCRRVAVKGETPLRVHIDGEFFCHAEDGVFEIAVEILPARLRVMCESAFQNQPPVIGIV